MASLFDGLNLGSSIADFQKSTTTAMSTVKESVLTPISIVQGKVNDGIALVKATDSKLTSVISGYKSAAISQLDGILGALSGGLLNTSDLTHMVKVGPDGITFSSDDLMKSVGDKIGIDLSNNGTGFLHQFANGINSEFGALTGNSFGELITQDGNTFHISKNFRGQAGSGLLNMLSRYAGLEELVDSSVSNAFYNTLLKNTAMYGMYDGYGGIVSKYINKRDATAALIDAVQYMLVNGDVDSLNKILEFLDKDGIMSVNAKYPNFTEALLSKFSFSVNSTVDQYPAIKATLLKVLTTFAGNDWYLKVTQFGSAYNLGLTSQISKDVITLLGDDSIYTPLLFTAGSFTDNSAVNELKSLLPEAPLLVTGS